MENHIKQVAEVTLSPGIIAWYDKLTKIYLTEQNPSEKIYNYMNTSNIRNAIKNKIIILSKGSLDFRRVPENVEEIEAKYNKNETIATASLEQNEPIQEVISNDIIDESIVSDEDIVSFKEAPEVPEVPVEEKVEIKPKKSKKNTKKNSKKDVNNDKAE